MKFASKKAHPCIVFILLQNFKCDYLSTQVLIRSGRINSIVEDVVFGPCQVAESLKPTIIIQLTQNCTHVSNF